MPTKKSIKHALERDAFEIYDYIQRSIAAKKLLAEHGVHVINAREALGPRLLLNEAFNEFVDWIHTYLSDAEWQRCLTALRQKHYRIKHSIKKITVSCDDYCRLEHYAEKRGISVAQAASLAIKSFCVTT